MNKFKIIGITGPTGAGKTTALKALEQLGAEILDADSVYHELLQNSEDLRNALVSAFGADILDPETQLVDRRRLADAVYPDGLPELNRITHPVVESELSRRIEAARSAGKRAAAIDAIALVESGTAAKCDVVVSILAPLELRVQRIMVRDSVDHDYARRRALAQPKDEFYREHSNFVLENNENDTPASFGARAKVLFEEILSCP